VCGTGLDRIYPDKHRALAKKMGEQGLVISEFPLGIPPKPQHFPQRNRIISGLSLGVLVVEAALQSGSLITARTASEQGREVFAIPGSIHNPLVKGCHSLIRQGAKLVESVEDILEEFSTFTRFSSFTTAPEKQEPILSLDDMHQNLFDNIGHEITSIDVLVLRTGLEASAISAMLLNLELEGFIKSALGGVVKCLP
jgi:DNA processing protein